MAIPLLALGAGSFILNKLFNKRPSYDLPPDPQFFGAGFEQVRAALEQKNQANYGGQASMLRENLANQGVLGNQGALTDAFTRLSIGQGQDIAAGNAALTGQEYGAQQAFGLQKYGAGVDRNRTLYEGDKEARQNEINSLTSIAGAYGRNKANASTIPNNPFSLTEPNDPQQSGFRKIIKTLFGF